MSADENQANPGREKILRLRLCHEDDRKYKIGNVEGQEDAGECVLLIVEQHRRGLLVYG